MKEKLFSAVHLLAALERSPEPMTIYELTSVVDDASVLPPLLEAGCVVRRDDGRCILSCDPAKLSLFELNSLLGPHRCDEERLFSEIFEDGLRDMTVSWLTELEKPKPVTPRDIARFCDCVSRIEQGTGELLPVPGAEDTMEFALKAY